MEPQTVGQLAAMVGGRVEGARDIVCRGAAPLHEASQHDITLVEGAGALLGENRPRVAAVLATAPMPELDLPQLIVDDLHDAFSAIVCYFRPRRSTSIRGVSPAAHVHPSARIGAGSVVHPGATIGADAVIGAGCAIHAGVTVMEGSQIGNDVVLFPGVVLYPDTVIEDRVTIHGGSVLGADGFGYRTRDGQHHRAPQLGYVHVESDVDIGACVTIDRGTYGATRIGRGTKIDNQVMIAHNCQIGQHNLICSQVGIAGSSHTGNYVVLAGQVGLADHVALADGVVVGAQAGVMHDLSTPGTYLGSPAMPHREQMQIFASLRRLPEVCRSVKRLERSGDSQQSSKKRAA